MQIHSIVPDAEDVLNIGPYFLFVVLLKLGLNFKTNQK